MLSFLDMQLLCFPLDDLSPWTKVVHQFKKPHSGKWQVFSKMRRPDFVHERISHKNKGDNLGILNSADVARQHIWNSNRLDTKNMKNDGFP